MSILRRASRSPQTEERSITYQQLVDVGILPPEGTGVTEVYSGTTEGALRHPTVWRSVNKIAGMVVQMPFHAFDAAGARVEPSPSILRAPSMTFRPAAWKRTAVTSLLLKGGVYGLTDGRRSRGQASTIELIHPDRVTWDSQRGWMIDHEPAPDEWPLGPFWQVPLMTLPGCPKGLNPIEYARRTTYAGLAAAEFGSNFVGGGGHPSAILAPEDDPGPDGAAQLKKVWKAATVGTSRDAAVLPQNVKYQQIQINPEDSQFIELMQFTGGQVAGFFGLDPSAVGLPVEGGSMDYSNRENRQQDVLQDAVMPVLIPLLEGLSELVPNGQTVKAVTEGLLRADLEARYRSYLTAAQIQQMTGQRLLDVNDEMRPLENREPLPDNDGGVTP